MRFFVFVFFEKRKPPKWRGSIHIRKAKTRNQVYYLTVEFSKRFSFLASRARRCDTSSGLAWLVMPLSAPNEKRSARCHSKRRFVSCPGPGRAAVVILAFVRPNKTAFMSGKCLVFVLRIACGVHRVPVRRVWAENQITTREYVAYLQENRGSSCGLRGALALLAL